MPFLMSSGDGKVELNDVVYSPFNDGSISEEWKLGIVVDILSPTRVVIEYCTSRVGADGLYSTATVDRSPRHCIVLVSSEELAINSQAYFDSIVASAPTKFSDNLSAHKS